MGGRKAKERSKWHAALLGSRPLWEGKGKLCVGAEGERLGNGLFPGVYGRAVPERVGELRAESARG